MRWTLTIGAAAAIAAVIIAAHTTASQAWQASRSEEPVVASFQRELNRKPGPSAPARRESIEQDELYELLNQTHWSAGNAYAEQPEGEKDDE